MGIKKIFGIVNSLLGRRKQALLHQHDDSLTLARLFNEYFITKIDNIRHQFPILEQDLPMPSSIHFNAILDVNLESSLTYFNPFLPKYLVRTASLWTELITKITPL